MNYYIQGDAAKAQQIKAALEKLGIKASDYDFSRKDVLFFTFEVKGKSYMMSAVMGSGLDNIILTHPDYKELELPVEPRFKDGDVLATDNGWTCIFKAFDGCVFSSYCFMDSQKWFSEFGSEAHTLDSRINGNIHLATKEQRDMLFKKMREAGYEWDADKKELRKIQPHYDIANFKPFDKVLVRDSNGLKWTADLFSYIDDNFICTGGIPCCQCIPFNEETKHLLGTTYMPSEEFINW